MTTAHARHDHTHGASEKRIGLAALLTGVFMVAEIVGGLVSGSLALLADAGHMVIDFASLGLAWYGFRLARRPADWRRTYGYDRFTTLAAFTNGLTLFAIAAWIVVEAWQRLREPTMVSGGVMLWIALGGLVINLVALRLLRGGDAENLNLRAAALHVAGDLLGSAATVVAAVIILMTGWTTVDAILSVLVALIILRSAGRIVYESGHILLEGAPPSVDNRSLAEDLLTHFPAIVDIHHVHSWSITEKRPMVTLHARLAEHGPPEQMTAKIKRRLHERFGVEHVTVEIEFEGCADEKLIHPNHP